MVHGILTHLTLLSLLLHAALGCGAQHAHADGTVPANASTAEMHFHLPGACRHHHEPPSAPTDGEHAPPPAGCDDLSCSYLVPAKVQLPPSGVCLWASDAATESAIGAPARRAPFAHGEVPIDWGRARTLPLHALHSVWII